MRWRHSRAGKSSPFWREISLLGCHIGRLTIISAESLLIIQVQANDLVMTATE